MFEKILVPVDGSDVAQHGLETAFALAARLHSTLRLLHVSSDFPFAVEMANPTDVRAYRLRVRQEARRMLDRLAERGRRSGVEVQTCIRTLKTTGLAAAIVADAGRTGCGLIVMGTARRRGLARVVAGSVAEEVARRCAVPVLLVGGPAGRAARRA